MGDSSHPARAQYATAPRGKGRSTPLRGCASSPKRILRAPLRVHDDLHFDLAATSLLKIVQGWPGRSWQWRCLPVTPRRQRGSPAPSSGYRTRRGLSCSLPAGLQAFANPVPALHCTERGSPLPMAKYRIRQRRRCSCTGTSLFSHAWIQTHRRDLLSALRSDLAAVHNHLTPGKNQQSTDELSLKRDSCHLYSVLGRFLHCFLHWNGKG